MKHYVYFISFTGVNLLMQPVNGNFVARLESKINAPEHVSAITQSVKQNMKLRDATLIGLTLLDELETPNSERGKLVDLRKGNRI